MKARGDTGVRRGLIQQADRNVVYLVVGTGGLIREVPDQTGSESSCRSLTCRPSPTRAHAAANLKFAFLLPARVLGPPPGAFHWWVSPVNLRERRRARGWGAEGASLTGTEAWKWGALRPGAAEFTTSSSDRTVSGRWEWAKTTRYSELV